MKNRPDFNDYFMAFAELAATRSTCIRQSVGAVIVRDKQIISTGYNGAPRGLKHCPDRGCLRAAENIPSGQRHELCRGLHAEQNAIIQAAYHGKQIKGGTLYCTHQPCSICVKMIINAGIRKVIYARTYDDSLGRTMALEANLVFSLFLPT